MKKSRFYDYQSEADQMLEDLRCNNQRTKSQQYEFEKYQNIFLKRDSNIKSEKEKEQDVI